MCGSALEFSVQKFCTHCGATLPDIPAVSGPPAGSPGIPVWIIVAAGLVLLLVAALIALPYVGSLVGTTSAGSGSNLENGITLAPTPMGTPPSASLTVNPSRTSTPDTVGKTLAPTIATPQMSIPTTKVPEPVQTATPLPSSTAPTPTPVPQQTSVITEPVTYTPSQPPVSSYTSSTPGAPYIDPGALEARVHVLINIQRQQNGLTSLDYDPFLADIARGHSWDMVQRNFFEHVNPDGLNPRARGDAAGYLCIRVMGTTTYEGIAENLFQGNRYSGYYTNAGGAITSYDWDSLENISQVTVNGWMNSPGHRQNILTPHFSYEGIGVAFSSDDKIYITENFC